MVDFAASARRARPRGARFVGARFADAAAAKSRNIAHAGISPAGFGIRIWPLRWFTGHFAYDKRIGLQHADHYDICTGGDRRMRYKNMRDAGRFIYAK